MGGAQHSDHAAPANGPPPDQLPAYPYLSPDGAHIAFENHVIGRDGHSLTLGPAAAAGQGIPRGAFRAQGWLDDHTVVGVLVQADGSAGKLGLVALGSPGQVRPLPQDGQFVAALQPSRQTQQLQT